MLWTGRESNNKAEKRRALFTFSGKAYCKRYASRPDANWRLGIDVGRALGGLSRGSGADLGGSRKSGGLGAALASLWVTCGTKWSQVAP